MSEVNFKKHHENVAVQLMAESLIELADYGVGNRYHAKKIVQVLESRMELMDQYNLRDAKKVVTRLQTKFGRLSETLPETEFILSPKSLAIWLCRRQNQYDHFCIIRNALQLAVEGVTEPSKIMTATYLARGAEIDHTPNLKTFIDWMISLRILEPHKEGVGYERGSQVPEFSTRLFAERVQKVIRKEPCIISAHEYPKGSEQADALEAIYDATLDANAACQMQWPPEGDAPQLWKALKGGWLLWDLDLCWPPVEMELRRLYAEGRGMKRLKELS